MHFVCLCAQRYLGSELPDILNKRTHHQMRTDTCTQITISILLVGSSRILIRFMFIFLFFYLDASALLFQLFANFFQIRPTCPTSRSVSSRSDSRTSDGHPCQKALVNLASRSLTIFKGIPNLHTQFSQNN
jgi:hypothetical protein